MKITSRSILSPGRPGSGREQLPTTLTTSLSRRRLKPSRSIKGGASPAILFPTGTGNKKRGSGFDNPEPSSPKVTCIGQVRVKSKKKHTKNFRSLSRRKTINGIEGSFRKFENLQRNNSTNNGSNNNNNQKWVHIPLTICEALRTFGSEVSCLFPCRSSCSSTTMQKQEKNDDGNTCGAVLARWLVTLQDGDKTGVEKEIEIMVGNDDGENVRRRRHVFQDLEIVNESVIMGSRDDEEGRVSICVPPKNALLLMRCGSDPMKMEALANRFWEPMMDDQDEEFGHDEEDEIDMANDQEDDLQYHEVSRDIVEMNMKQSYLIAPLTGMGIVVADIKQSVQEENVEKCNFEEAKIEMELEMEVKQTVQEEYDDKKESIEINEESFYLECLFEENGDQEQDFKKEEDEDDDDDFDMEDALKELFREECVQEIETGESNIEKVKLFEDMVTESKDNCDNETQEEIVMELDKVDNEILEEENEETGNTSKALPECLLLMMYEPKLSMEVSKETWVCSRDFVRPNSSRKKPPQPLAKSIESQDESKVNGSSTTSDHVTTHEQNSHVLRMSTVQYESGLHQPARSSCSFPAPLSMATLLEQKLVNTIGYEPLVLTRCKSEPMRTAAAKLRPDTCYWKNKLEPPRRASFGIGMAGLGF
uniref:aspartic and glutamic acid-rich protein-like n=1 Tax=Erigeron canadensis TaxID=72917 RepID=UPI001CB9BC0E|nr:aspartic and glutamic acid-rich protein-like [Erigeron canadensis]